ncbi:PREDICTED: probable sucrose-phosphatase 3a isoform X2 [Tarenaya hassleriana]|uniref:probable sucrose-phosphatase 3a isoform X2 n=1 Tax=Tarenaya hassleriana TaxID=28532 RepID=UPI00053C2D6C|nr:PREDICTED: probable sucrose-phosphatase 3a isoform X2 [Tarenaya hassleriana]
MDRFDGSPNLMLVTDLDCTLVDHDDPDNTHLLRFNALWEAYFRRDSLLVFSTGRSSISYSNLRRKKPLLTPDIAITSVGAEIMYSGQSVLIDDDWEALLDHKWDRDIVVEETSKFPELKPQAEKNQGRHKVSFNVERDKAMEIMEVLPERLEKRGLDTKLIYSNDFAFDVLPRGAGKGGALSYLLEKLKMEGREPLKILVCGDSGNDAELFGFSQAYGVMVGNSHDELLQWHEENVKSNPNIIHATGRCAAGIIEAIQRFDMGPSLSPRDVLGSSGFWIENHEPALEVVQFYLFYEKWRRGEVEKSDKCLQSLKSHFNPLSTFVHPSGEEQPIYGCIDEMEKLHGDMKEKQYHIWLDGVSSSQIGSDTWLAKFDKHEMSAEGNVRSCSTKVLLNYKKKREERGGAAEKVGPDQFSKKKPGAAKEQ